MTPKMALYGLVRDKNGKPRIDGDPRRLPEPIKAMMTAEEYRRAIEDYDDAHS